MVGLMKNINRIARCAEQYRNDRLEPFGLTGSQYSVILSVCREPGITQDRLSELVYINKSNVARQLSQLEENGYVTREQGEKDRRTIKGFRKEKSLETVPVIRDTLRQWSEYITEGFDESEKEILLAMLEKMKDRAAEYLEKGYIAKGKED